MSQVPNVALNNGVEIPQLGFGVFQIPPEQTKDATLEALRIGYRHIDTAQGYRNEAGVGDAVRESGLPRDAVFVTSKLSNQYKDPAEAIGAFDRSMDALDLGYLDLFLIHWPMPTSSDYVGRWRALEQILASGRVRAIGVSNFQVPHLERLAAETNTVPVVNQIEVHPYLTNETVRAYNTEHGIATEAWSPIAQGKVLDDPVIVRIAAAVDRSPAQVTLRWHLQLGNIVFPKSVTPARVRENFELFDFELDAQQMGEITALNRDERVGPDPDVLA